MKVKDEGEDGGERSREHPRPRAVCGVVRMVGLGARIYIYIDRSMLSQSPHCRVVHTRVYLCT